MCAYVLAYGHCSFYEPPEHKIRMGKLTFREAVELMSARLKAKVESDAAASAAAVQLLA